MRGKVKSALARALGLLILLAPASIQTPGLFYPFAMAGPHAEVGKDKNVSPRSEAGGLGGLYGYRYRGF